MSSGNLDKRFDNVGNDPKFRSMPRRYKKTKIDHRFDAMFKDKNFRLKYTVDKRGRPVHLSTSEDLRRYYDVGDSESESDGEEDASKDNSAGDGTRDSEKSELDSEVEQEEQECEGPQGEEGESDKTKKTKKTRGHVDSLEVTDKPEKKKQKGKERAKKKSEKTFGRDDQAGSEADKSAQSALQEQTSKDEEVHSSDKEVEPDHVEDDEEIGDDVRERLMDMTVDYARGGGVLLEDSSSDDESEPEEVGLEHAWAELDRDAPRISDEQTTSRLAVCNMDWDRIKALDILVVLSSFLPPAGVIKDVAIYPSEFGKKRMAEEEELGPRQLFDEEEPGQNTRLTASSSDQSSSEESESEDEQQEEDPEVAERSRLEHVRRYQLSRLRYFYAVVQCDSRDTAVRLYQHCEGMEFESSASRIDLRFIPEDMTFDQDVPRDRCSALPEAGRYRPSQFITSALQQRLVRLTWDETDADRQRAVRQAAVDTDTADTDIRAYLASSSDSDSEQDGGSDAEGGEREEEEGDEKARIARYRALLAGIDQETEQEKGDVEMEITWGVGIKEKTEELVKRKEMQKELTPWEKYMEKQKTKKKNKAAGEKKRREVVNSSNASESEDSDVPSDVADDPFFKQELDARKEQQQQKKQKDRKQKKKKATAGGSDSEEDDADKAQLALLVMDEAEEHFNFKDIVREEAAAGKKKRKWKRKRKPGPDDTKADDDFQVDVGDPRFSRLYSSHLYNVDPSHPQYRNTTGMQSIVQEKQRRTAASGDTQQLAEPALKQARVEPRPPPVSRGEDLGALVRSIKSRTQHVKNRKTAKS